MQLKGRYTKKTRARISIQHALSDLFKRTFTPFSPLVFCQVSVQSLSHVWLFATPWTEAHRASLSITSSQSLFRLMSIESVMPPNHIVPFFCFQSFSESGSFQMSQFLASGGQSTGIPASPSVLPMNIQDWFPLGLTGLISLQSKGLPRVFSNTTKAKQQPAVDVTGDGSKVQCYKEQYCIGTWNTRSMNQSELEVV